MPVFKDAGIEFVHGDIRNLSDLNDLGGNFDWLIEASAEPSVLAGVNSSPNVCGSNQSHGHFELPRVCPATYRRHGLPVLCTNVLPYSAAGHEPHRSTTYLEIAGRQLVLGLSIRGFTENFPTHLPLPWSIYGAMKLASEMLIQEYVEAYDLKAVINRCGVIVGAGQFGKVEQGLFTHWIANHYFGKSLRYTGFEGTGKQVGDLFHSRDLYSLIRAEMGRSEDVSGAVFNVGGGPEISTSLLEYTRVCQEITGREVPSESRLETSPARYSSLPI